MICVPCLRRGRDAGRLVPGGAGGDWVNQDAAVPSLPTELDTVTEPIEMSEPSLPTRKASTIPAAPVCT